MKKQTTERGLEKRVDSWERFAWAVLIFLILFHVTNNYIVLKLDGSYFMGDEWGVHRYALRLLKQHAPSLTQKLATFYYSDTTYEGFYPPFFGGISSAFMAVFGISQDVAVMANAPFVAALLISTYALGKVLFNRETGLTAAILLSFFPGVFSFARSGRVDFALTAMVTLTMLLLIKSDHMASLRWSILLGVTLGLAALTKTTFSLYLIGPFVVLVAIPLARLVAEGKIKDCLPILRNILLAGFIVILLVAPWYASNTLHAVSGFGRCTPNSVFNSPMRLLTSLDLRFMDPILFLRFHLLMPGTLLFIAAFLYFLWRERRHTWVLLSWMLIPYLFIILLGSPAEGEVGLPREMLPIDPAIALIMGWGLSKFVQSVLSPPRSGALRRGTYLTALVLLAIEIPVFFSISYADESTLGRILPKDMPVHNRIELVENSGRMSPYQHPLDTSNVVKLLGSEWAGKTPPPRVFILNRLGYNALGLLGDLEGKKGTSMDFTVLHCFGDEIAQSGGETTCQDLFESADYAVLEPIQEQDLLNHPDKQFTHTIYRTEVAPLAKYIKENLDEFTILKVIPMDYREFKAADPSFGWLNESIWVLRRETAKEVS